MNFRSAKIRRIRVIRVLIKSRNQSKLLLTTVCLLLLFASPALSKGEPKWISEVPSDPCFFYGHAKVPRTGNASNDLNAARNEALNNIRQQISVFISSETRYQVAEKDKSWSSDYINSVIARVPEIKIEGHEQVDKPFYQKKHVHVLYRLSRRKYYGSIHGPLKQAVDDALALYTEALGRSIQERYVGYMSALEISAPFKDANVSYKVCGEEVSVGLSQKLEGKIQSLDRFLARKLRGLLQYVQIIPDSPELSFSTDKNSRVDIRVVVINKDQPLAGFPLQVLADDTTWKYTSPVKTGSDGRAVFKLTRPGFPGKKIIQIVPHHSGGDSLIRQYDLTLPFAAVEVNRPSPGVYLDIKEKNIGSSSDVYIKRLRGLLGHQGNVQFVSKQKADIIVSGSVRAVKDGTQGRLSRAGIRVDMKLKAKSGKTMAFKRDKGKGLKANDHKAAGEKGLAGEADRNALELLEIILDLETR
ncbi:LPP20 family lipoprotein [Fibrobacterota bacterium]